MKKLLLFLKPMADGKYLVTGAWPTNCETVESAVNSIGIREMGVLDYDQIIYQGLTPRTVPANDHSISKNQ